MVGRTRRRKYQDSVSPLDTNQEEQNWISKNIFLASLGIITNWPSIELKQIHNPCLTGEKERNKKKIEKNK